MLMWLCSCIPRRLMESFSKLRSAWLLDRLRRSRLSIDGLKTRPTEVSLWTCTGLRVPYTDRVNLLSIKPQRPWRRKRPVSLAKCRLLFT